MRIGMENRLMQMLTDPELIHTLFTAHAQLIIDIFEGMRDRGLAFDGVFRPDDLGYNSGPLISPTLYRDLVMPYHKRLCDHFAERGLKTILHADGDISRLIPYFIEAGFKGLHPLEVKAGLDMPTLYDLYGDRLFFFGNIDVRALAGTHEEIEAEIVLDAVEGRDGDVVWAAFIGLSNVHAVAETVRGQDVEAKPATE